MKDDAADRMHNSSLHKSAFSWRDRRGVVHHVTNNGREAVVYWDGRRSADLVPLKFVEPEHETEAD